LRSSQPWLFASSPRCARIALSGSRSPPCGLFSASGAPRWNPNPRPRRLSQLCPTTCCAPWKEQSSMPARFALNSNRISMRPQLPCVHRSASTSVSQPSKSSAMKPMRKSRPQAESASPFVGRPTHRPLSPSVAAIDSAPWSACFLPKPITTQASGTAKTTSSTRASPRPLR
jgi:hypothetical protein